jgi:chromosome segregation ATPase
MNYPEEIEGAFLELAATDERIRRRRLEIRSLELDITLDATTAKDEHGKLILSNEMQRKAAIEKMLTERKEYAEYAEELSGLEQDRIKLQARLRRLEMEFKVEMTAADYRNALAILESANAIFKVRHGEQLPPEFEMPF